MVSHCLAVLSADVIDLQAGVPAGALAKKGGKAGDAFHKHYRKNSFSQTRFVLFLKRGVVVFCKSRQQATNRSLAGATTKTKPATPPSLLYPHPSL
jgi:hypothetical protein